MPALVTVSFPSVTGLPEDTVVHDWAITNVTDASSAAVVDEVLDEFTAFYTTDPALNESAPGKYLSDVLSRTQSSVIRMYDITDDLSGTPHGSPFASRSFLLPAPVSSDALPSEISAVLTIEAEGRDDAAVEVGNTRPKQRRTGRVFFGPLVTTVLSTVDGVVRVSSLFRDRVLLAAQVLETNLRLIQDPDISVGVWSRADAAVRPVEFWSMDNAFDIQRRRGEDPSVRTRVDAT